ncbi:putative inorganic carbon (hco3(-)) transporter [Candidatus Magnetomoraceae bacterium gMMP-15]
MKLSTKKIKQIRRAASDKTPKQIAKEFNIPIKDIEKVLNKAKINQKNNNSKPFFNKSLIDSAFFWLMAVFIFVAPFAIKNGIYDFANLPQCAFIQVGVVFFLILWFIKESIQKRSRLLKNPFQLPLLLFIIWAALSLKWAANVFEGVTAWMQWAGPFLAFLLVVHSFNKKQCFYLLNIVFWSGFCVALLGIFQHLFNVTWVPQVAPPSSTFANKNMAVHIVIMTLPLGTGFFLAARQRTFNWIYSIPCSMMTSYLIYTRTRAGWVTFGFQLVFWIIIFFTDHFNKKIKWGWNKDKSISFAAGLVLFVMMIHLTSSGFAWTLGGEYKRLISNIKALSTMEHVENTNENIEEAIKEEKADKKEETDIEAPAPVKRTGESSFAGRIAIWRNSLVMIQDYFLTGVGLGNHKVFYPLYFRKVVVERWFSEQFQLTNAHNDYVQTWSELGTIGMCFLGWLAFAIFRAVRRILSFDKENRLIILGLSVGILGLFVNAFFSFPFQRAIPPFFLMVFLGVLGILYAESIENKYLNLPSWLFPCFTGVTILGFIFLVRLESKWIECDRYYLRITSAEKAQVWKGVIHEANNAIALNPHRKKILSYMGRAYIESGNSKKGIEALKQVIEVYPNHMNAMLNLGVAYGNTGDYDKALEIYGKVINIKPDYAKVHNNIANIYMKQKNMDNALKEFELAASYDPDNPVIHFNVGIVALNKKLYEKARKGFEKAVELKPSWDMAHKNLGVVLYQFLKEPQKGIEHFREALKINPKLKDYKQIKKIVDESYFNRGVEALNQKKYKEAKELFEKAVKIKPDWAIAHKNLGMVLFQFLKEIKKGLKHFEIALALDQKIKDHEQISKIIAEFGFNKGIEALKQKKYKEAKQGFQKAVKFRPDWAMAHKNLGMVLFQFLKEREEGVKHFKKALSLNPKIQEHEKIQKIIASYKPVAKPNIKPETKASSQNNKDADLKAETHLDNGKNFMKKNKFNKAIQEFKQAVVYDPENPIIHFNIGVASLNNKSYNEAIQAFEKAAIYEPKNPVIYFNIGVASLNKKSYKESAQAFQKTIDLNPRWAMAQKNMGMVLFEYLKKPKESVKYFKEALKLDPKIKDYENMEKIVKAYGN